jgi:hypothetical protein
MNMQLADDNNLLDDMMSDMQKANVLYRPTDYWLTCQRVFMPELKRKGLKNFRRRHHSILGSFSAVDLLVQPTLQVRAKFPGSRWLSRMFTGIVQRMPLISLGISEFEPQWLTPYFYHHTQEKFERTRFRLMDCPSSRWGNPEDLATLGGGTIPSGIWSMPRCLPMPPGILNLKTTPSYANSVLGWDGM